jgi:hypothetical protein
MFFLTHYFLAGDYEGNFNLTFSWQIRGKLFVVLQLHAAQRLVQFGLSLQR